MLLKLIVPFFLFVALSPLRATESPADQFYDNFVTSYDDFAANKKISYVKASPGVFIPETAQTAWNKLLSTQNTAENSAVAAAMSLNTAYQHAVTKKKANIPIITHLLYSAARLVSGQTASLNVRLPLTDKIKDTYFSTAFNVGQDVLMTIGSIREGDATVQGIAQYLSQCFSFNPKQKLSDATNRHRFILTLAALASYYWAEEDQYGQVINLDAFKGFAKNAFSPGFYSRIDAVLTTFRKNFERLLSSQCNEQIVSYKTIPGFVENSNNEYLSVNKPLIYSLPFIKVAKPIYIRSGEEPINLEEIYTQINKENPLLPVFVNKLRDAGAVFTSFSDIASIQSLLMYYLAKEEFSASAIVRLIKYKVDSTILYSDQNKSEFTIIKGDDLYLEDDSENPYLFNQAPPA